MKNFVEYLPYIVSVLVAFISGVASYLAAAKKCRTDMKALKESNAHEINRLMEQHKLDIDSLERKHKMEIEKMELEHRYQLELKTKDAENTMNGNFFNTIVGEAMKTPEARQIMGQAMRNKNARKR